MKRKPLNPAARTAVMTGILLCSACSIERPAAPTTGRITFNGEPLTSGSILFVPTEPGPTAQANLSTKGEYVLSTYGTGDGAVIGQHEIMVVSLKEDTGPHAGEPDDGLPSPHGRDPRPMISVIPERYGDYHKSGLRATVVKGENRFDLALSSDPPPAVTPSPTP